MGALENRLYVTFTQPYEGDVIIPVLQMKTLRLRDGRCNAQGHRLVNRGAEFESRSAAQGHALVLWQV